MNFYQSIFVVLIILAIILFLYKKNENFGSVKKGGNCNSNSDCKSNKCTINKCTGYDPGNLCDPDTNSCTCVHKRPSSSKPPNWYCS